MLMQAQFTIQPSKTNLGNKKRDTFQEHDRKHKNIDGATQLSQHSATAESTGLGPYCMNILIHVTSSYAYYLILHLAVLIQLHHISI